MRKKVKIIIKRPLIHYVIILAYIVAPVVNILLLRIVLNIPLSTIIPRLFKGYGILATIWLLTAPIVGIVFYFFVHRLSWYIFIGHSFLILLDYILKWAIRPSFYWQTIPTFHNFLLLTGNLLLVLIIGYIIQKDFRAPYFQVLQRSWRESKRVPIYHKVILDGRPRKINDLSTGGCFIPEPELGLNVGDRVSINFKSDTLTIDCEGEVMNHRPEGYGIQFLSLPATKKRDIKRMLKKRFSLRYEIDLAGTWIFNQKRLDAKILNISTGGCYIQTDVAELEEGYIGEIETEINGHRYLLPGKIVWINISKEHEKPIGFGLKFASKQRKLMRLIMDHYGKLKLTR